MAERLPEDAWLTDWIDAWGDRLVRYAYVLTKDYHHAQDVTQETFMRLMVFHEKYPEREISPGWLFTVARREALTHYRRRKHETLIDSYGTMGETDLHVWLPPAFRELLEHLSLVERETIWLFYYQDWSTDAIARYLHQSPGAVRGRLMRVRKKLRALWEEER